MHRIRVSGKSRADIGLTRCLTLSDVAKHWVNHLLFLPWHWFHSRALSPSFRKTIPGRWTPGRPSLIAGPQEDHPWSLDSRKTITGCWTLGRQSLVVGPQEDCHWLLDSRKTVTGCWTLGRPSLVAVSLPVLSGKSWVCSSISNISLQGNSLRHMPKPETLFLKLRITTLHEINKKNPLVLRFMYKGKRPEYWRLYWRK